MTTPRSERTDLLAYAELHAHCRAGVTIGRTDVYYDGFQSRCRLASAWRPAGCDERSHRLVPPTRVLNERHCDSVAHSVVSVAEGAVKHVEQPRQNVSLARLKRANRVAPQISGK